MASIPTSLQAKAKAAYTAAEQLGIFRVQDHYKAQARGFMDLHIERIRDDYSCGPFEAWSLCHYFEQNGDLCQDPEMLLLADHQRHQLYPAWFQQAIPPVFRRSIEQVSEAGLSYRPKELLDQQNFLAMWLHNLRAQGFEISKATGYPGGQTRAEYLASLAEQYGIPLATVRTAADMLGPNEDFDGLVTELEDLADELND